MTKNTAKKMPMKKMFAAVRAIYDREDLEDSEVKVFGVYASKKKANEELEKRRAKDLKSVADDPDEAERMIDGDCDRYYDWYVTPVSVEI